MALIKKRNAMVDVLKGFAIVLVVIGHLIQMQISPDHFDSNIFFKLIYSFHMPLFFFLAGNVFKVRPLSEELFISFKRLILPFLIFFLIVSCNFDLQLFKLKILDYFLNPQLGFWFLFVLAAIRVIFDILMLVNKTCAFTICISMLITAKFIGKLFAIDYVLFYLPFFAAGYFLSNNNLKFFEKLKSLLFGDSFVSFFKMLILILAYSYVFNFYHRNLTGVSFVEFILQKSILGILGIMISYEIFRRFDFGRLNNFLEFLGRYTLFIYGLHLIFIGWYNYLGVLSIIPMLFIPIAIGKTFYFMLSKFNTFFSNSRISNSL